MRPAATTWKANRLDAAARELAGFVADGYRAVKLKCVVRCRLMMKWRLIRAVREAIGPGRAVHAGHERRPYDVAGCILFAQAVAPYDIFLAGGAAAPVICSRWISSASPPRRRSRWRMASASVRHRYTVRDFLDPGAIRYVQFDLDAACRVHGILLGGSRTMPNRRACADQHRIRRGICTGTWSRHSAMPRLPRNSARRCGTPPAAPRDLPRRRRGEGWHGVPVRGAGVRDGNRLAGRGEVPRMMVWPG